MYRHHLVPLSAFTHRLLTSFQRRSMSSGSIIEFVFSLCDRQQGSNPVCEQNKIPLSYHMISVVKSATLPSEI